jgi:hypothetical protein
MEVDMNPLAIILMICKEVKLGMLTDVPEEWGVNYPPENPIKDLMTQKSFD